MSELSESNFQGRVQLRWPLEDSLETLFANQFGIVRQGAETVLVFGEFLPAGLAGRSNDEVAGYLQEAPIKPVAKIVMTLAGFDAFYAMLKRNVEGEADDAAD